MNDQEILEKADELIKAIRSRMTDPKYVDFSSDPVNGAVIMKLTEGNFSHAAFFAAGMCMGIFLEEKRHNKSNDIQELEDLWNKKIS